MNKTQKHPKKNGITKGRPSNNEIQQRQKIISDILNSEYNNINTISALRAELKKQAQKYNLTLPSSNQTLIKDIEAAGFHCVGTKIINDYIQSPVTYHLMGILSEQIKKIDMVIIKNDYDFSASENFDNSMGTNFFLPMNQYSLTSFRQENIISEKNSNYFLIILKEHKHEQLIAELIYSTMQNYVLYIETGICYIKIFFDNQDSMKKISDFINIITRNEG